MILFLREISYHVDISLPVYEITLIRDYTYVQIKKNNVDASPVEPAAGVKKLDS